VTPLLTINHLSVALQNKPVLQQVDLALYPGEIMGLVGPSGCGKTTLLNTIAGFIEQSEGEIHLTNETTISPRHFIAPEQRQIGMIFQDYALFPHLTVEQNVVFGIQKLPKDEQQQRSDHLLTLLQLSDFAKRYPHQLSGGQQQRVAIARALAPQPKLLLLDEPFSNIDARLRNELMLELRSLLKQLNMTAIFVTHNKDEVFTFADKIAVMHQGKVLQSGSPTGVFQQPNSWQVADFLQIGSWLAITNNHNTWVTALGALPLTITEKNRHKANYLLLKSKDIRISDNAPANVKVSAVSVTEQGFHYHFSSLLEEPQLQFDQLSFYCQDDYSLGQELAIEIIAHDYQIFAK